MINKRYTIDSTDSLDDFTSDGIAFVFSRAAPLNAGGMMKITNYLNYVEQEVVSFFDNSIYYRCRMSSGAWEEWKKITATLVQIS